MTNEQKRQVRDALVRYAANFETQSDASASLQGISSSTISQVKNNNWELLSDRLWHHIARQVGFFCGEWQAADTSAYLLLRILFGDAQHYSMTYGISIGDGLGKTFTAGHYIREQANTYYIAGCDQYNRRSFVTALLNMAGIDATGTVPEMTKQLVAHISGQDEPLLIIDDAHKLKDRVLHLVVQLANSLLGNAGIIIMGDGALRTRIIEGVRMKKVGFDEIYKSIGRRFITLSNLAPKDTELVCRANGIYDEHTISYIAQVAGNNLHTVTDLVMQQKDMNIAA